LTIKKQIKIKLWLIGVFVLLLLGFLYSNVKPYLIANNISYSVQISAAYQQKIEIEYLLKKFRLNENIREDYHKGWFKYSVGSFPDYYEARSYRDNLINNHNTKGAFVVMFKDDIRMNGMDTLDAANEPTKTYQQPDKKINYRIQVKTSTTKLDIEELQKNLNLTEPISEEFENGLYRYTIGYFENLDDAKNLHYRVVNIDKITDAFIATYFGDKRIGYSSTQKRTAYVETKRPEPVKTKAKEETPKPVENKTKEKKEIPPQHVEQSKTDKKNLTVTENITETKETNFPKNIILFSTSENQLKLVRKKLIQQNSITEKQAQVNKTTIEKIEIPVRKQENISTEKEKPKTIENTEKQEDSKPVLSNDSITKSEDHVTKDTSEYIETNVITSTSDYDTTKTNLNTQKSKKWHVRLFNAIKAQAFKDFVSKFITLLILYFLVNIIIVTSIVFISRIRKVRKENKIRKIEEEFQNLLAQFLFDELSEKEAYDKLNSVRGKFRRNILIEELMKLSKDLSGEVLDKLKSLYFSIGLDKDSFDKLENRRWFVKVKGLRELTRMKTYSAKPEIEKYLNSKNSILRAEAQLALIELNEEDPYYFLDKLEQTFLPWEQLNVHVMMQRYSYEIPDFSRWLMSENESVVLFAIEMIRVHKQIMNAPKIIRFFNHPNPLLKEAAIITAGELGYIEVVPELMKVYNDVENEYKVIILRAMQRLADDDNKDFLKGILDSDAPQHIKLDAAKAMFAIGIKGQIELKQYAQSNDEELIAIVKHVFDERI
jgi:hypothetical protein